MSVLWPVFEGVWRQTGISGRFKRVEPKHSPSNGDVSYFFNLLAAPPCKGVAEVDSIPFASEVLEPNDIYIYSRIMQVLF